jgi:hypothetical protein
MLARTPERTLERIGKVQDSVAGRAIGETPDQGRFENREKTSLSKLLVAVAIDAYGYDPTARRSPIPNEIQNIAAALGLTVSTDTIRQYLQMGARHLPRDWKPPAD